MRFVYADPPYLGCAVKHYGDRHEEAAVYDTLEGHAALIERLLPEECWALSMTSGNLRALLPLCPETARVTAWVKPFASFKPGVNPAYAWEPIVVNGGRRLGRDVPTVRDWVSAPITLRRGLTGVKPEAVCFWLFEFMGMAPDDELVDLFPGSGAVSAAFQSWRRQRRFA